MSEYYRPANFDGGVTSEIIDNKIVISFPDYYTDEDKEQFVEALKKMLRKPNATVIYGSETICRNHFADNTSFPIDSHNLTSHKSADWW